MDDTTLNFILKYQLISRQRVLKAKIKSIESLLENTTMKDTRIIYLFEQHIAYAEFNEIIAQLDIIKNNGTLKVY